MKILIHPGGELPIYRQIMRQITEALAVGALRPGDKLPSHRDLAEELVIAPLTIKKAYDEMEQLGFLETRRGRGTFVSLKQPRMKLADQQEEIQATARKLLSIAYMVGLEFPDVVAMLKKAEAEFEEESREAEASRPSN